MTVEECIRETLKSLVDDRVFPDIAPEGTDSNYITYQQVGGTSVSYLDGSAPEIKNSRFQINVWGKRRNEVKAIMASAGAALMAEKKLRATSYGEPVDTYEKETDLRGSRQDFSFWFDPN